ncbi:IucA/IucC family protein [Shimazuella alba]|uniref:IucA/IucC family siderophore biosynthesis protein n=1 Tax=Shimazuella alba TaxID=2690964 RepID=A0A6I4VX24_9BACL|nr:IucA/IucC family protein [Shimazuella alba]MXQ55178.1 IucA/IucC family siderophore biosynthesis protein [Shimazuella alba]
MSKTIAEQASMQNFINCYLREVDNFVFIEDNNSNKTHSFYRLFSVCQADKLVICPLPHHGIHIVAPIKYWSLTGRHLFQFPWHYLTPSKELLSLDYVTLVTLITKELSIHHHTAGYLDKLVSGTIQSCQHIDSYISARKTDRQELYHPTFRFIDAEQSLVFGHPMHPTPKSRQGFSDLDQQLYSPEQKGNFPLHFFRAHQSIIKEDSTFSLSATQLIKKELLQDPLLNEPFKKQFLNEDEYSILPIHPIQAQHLLQKREIIDLMDKELLMDLGVRGRAYFPTSSVRTLYHPQARFMLKSSLNIKITNSVRVNKLKELARGVEVSRILESKIGSDMKKRFPKFSIIQDPAYLTIQIPSLEESGFELVLRENPFMKGQDKDVTLLAGLGQDPIVGDKSRLANIITELAHKEHRNIREVSLDWFNQYLSISFEPIMWLYLQYGIALEAHQQNSLVQLHNGYPHHFYYRDNQGYYYCESTFSNLEQILPGINQQSQTMCADEVADERLRYYLFINHIFGLINAFGTSELIDEEELLIELRKSLVKLQPLNREPSTLISSLLEKEQLPCKANLLTRLYDMDELEGPMESQSVYVHISNPLVKGVTDNGITSSS